MPRKGFSAEDFETKDLKDHILDIPDTYVGSTDRRKVTEWIFDLETESMKSVEIDIPEAVKRVTLEIISNAGDAAYFSQTEGINPGKIELNWDDEGYLSVKNGGLPVPVEPHKKSTDNELYLVPTDVFSVPLTSSNYDVKKDRLGCGRNGYGSKLTNSFSKHFIVHIGDSNRTDSKGKPISGQEYFGEWKNNMRELVTSKAVPGFEYDSKESKWVAKKESPYGGSSFVEISWLLDFKRMNMERNNYSPEEIGLFCRYMIEFSLTCGVPVSLNGKDYDFRSIRKFAGLFFPEEMLSTGISQFCQARTRPFPRKFSSLKKDDLREQFIIENNLVPESQIFLMDTPDNGRTFSYVNGLLTIEGGVHVDELHKRLFGPIVKSLNDKHKGSIKLNVKDVKAHVTVFLVCRLLNSKYNSQSKTKLENPTPDIYFQEEQIKQIMSDDWKLVRRLENVIDTKNDKKWAQSDGKKEKHVDVEKLEDANEAGTKNSSKCNLYIVEGSSASGYAENRIPLLEGGNDYNGIYQIKGKIMNVTDMLETAKKRAKLEKCKELIGIKKALALTQGMDYTSEKNFKTLRYGCIIITTDADSDGMHILGLIVNLFHRFWPSLLQRGFVKHLVTPVVRAIPSNKKQETLRFYNEYTFLEWFKQNGESFKGKIKYLKGLASSKDEFIEEDVETAPVVSLEYDDPGKDIINLAFDKTRSNDRKTWIQNWREIRSTIKPYDIKNLEDVVPIKDVMSISFPPYMIDNLVRSIPSFSDGIKKSQRQVLYYGLHHFGYGNSKEDDTVKVVPFSTSVMGYCKYHHGDMCLNQITIKMTRDYCGSNNLPYFKKDGQFGSRKKAAKSKPQARYLEISCPWWYKYVFNKEMIDLVPRREVDGEYGEPEWIPCDIPLGVINGNIGVATGWSTYIPSHHPIQVVDWILARLAKKKIIDPLAPFYNGFTGTIDVKQKLAKTDDKQSSAGGSTSSVKDDDDGKDGDDSEKDDDGEAPEFVSGRGFITRGKFEVIKEYGGLQDIFISEIPVTTSLMDYREFLNGLRKAGRISDFSAGKAMEEKETKKKKIESNKVEFIVNGISECFATYKNLKLERGYSYSNLVLIDDDGIPTKYDSIESIVSKYISKMLVIYATWKDYNIRKMKERIEAMSMELKIILAYLDGSLKVHKRTDEEVDKNLEELKLSKKVFDSINLRKLTKDRVEALKNKIEELQKELTVFEAKSVEKLWSERLIAFKKEFIRRKVYPKTLEETIIVKESTNIIIDGERSYKRAKIEYH